MRVLHIAKVSGMGGTERMLLGLLPHLRSEGVDAHMLVLASDDADRFVEPLSAAGVPTQTVLMNHDVSVRALPMIVGAARRLSPDILHTHLFHADLYGQLAARFMRIPSVSTMQSVMTFFSRQPYRALARAAHANAFATIAISQHVANYLHSTGITTPSKTEVIWPGIDVGGWRADQDRRASARAGLGIPADAFVIGMTGRVTQGKGHEVLLAAFEQLGEDPTVRLVMAGAGERFGNVTALASRSPFADRIHMPGYCPDIKSVLAGFDVAVVPTTPDLDEGFGLVAVEAMAFGLPVVASSLGALTEVVADGVTGTLVRPNDDAALALALRALRDSPA
ncbi:MAG: glycosyltransferase, partial [Actinobacteria bacterium]|nr:glycosyltransferase [Actinomycetota bacterium]